MTFFTNLKALQNSNAERSRVKTVELGLRKINPNWDAKFWFPTPVVALTNVVDDYDWVLDSRGVHLGSDSQTQIMAVGSSLEVTTYGLYEALTEAFPDRIHIPRASKSATATQFLLRFNEVLSKLFGLENYDWALNPLYLKSDAASIEFPPQIPTSGSVVDEPAIEAKVEQPGIAVDEAIENKVVLTEEILVNMGKHLSGITPEQLATVLRSLHEEKTHDTCIFEDGNPGPEVFQLVLGTPKVTTSIGGGTADAAPSSSDPVIFN